MTSALAKMLGPAAPEEIMIALEAGDVRHFACGGVERLRGMIGWRQFAEWLSLYEPDAETLEATKDGKRVPNEWLTGMSGAQSLSGPLFARLARQGLSVTLRRLEQRSPSLRKLWHSACRALGCPVHINAIATFGSGRAFMPHYDGQDIIIVQVAGSKGWEMIGEQMISECADLTVRDGAVIELSSDTPFSPSLILRPGDVLAVPCGQPHRCWSEASSLHLGFAIRRHSGGDYLAWFANKVRDLPELRLPVGFPTEPAAAQRFDDEVRQRLDRLMKKFGPQAFLAERTKLDAVEPISPADLPDDARDFP